MSKIKSKYNKIIIQLLFNNKEKEKENKYSKNIKNHPINIYKYILNPREKIIN